MKKCLFVFTLIFVMALAVSAQATFTVITCPCEGCPEGVTYQFFTVDQSNVYNGSKYTLTFTDFGVASDYSSLAVSGGVLADRVLDTTYTFNSVIKTFSGYFDFTPGGAGTGIDVYADGNFVGSILNPVSGTFVGFWGFASTVPFTTVQFVQDGQVGSFETYNANYIAYCPAPIPGSLLLLGSGVLGLVGIGVRRRS